MIHLGRAADHCCRPVAVRALHGRNAFGNRQARRTSVRCGTRDAAKIDVAGRGQHLNAVTPALVIRTPVEFIEAGVENPHHEVVGVIVVVAVFAGFVQQSLAENFLAGKIFVRRGDQIGERDNWGAYAARVLVSAARRNLVNSI